MIEGVSLPKSGTPHSQQSWRETLRFGAITAALALVAFLAPPNSGWAGPRPAAARQATAAQLIAHEGPRLSAAIEWLHGGPQRRMEVFFNTNTYIECEPGSAPSTTYCLAPCADAWPWLEQVLTPRRIARLHAAGYADPGVEYSKEYAAGEKGDSIAAELLTLLHDVYGYDGRKSLTLVIETPSPP